MRAVVQRVSRARVWVGKQIAGEIGTASDRYAGWIGQIYTPGKYEKGITRRRHKVKDQTFTEETLPVESVTEYFEHFPILEIE